MRISRPRWGSGAAAGRRRRWCWCPSCSGREKLTDRLAAGAVRARLEWKCLLGLPLDVPGFGLTVLAEFRGKAAGGLEQVAMDALLERLVSAGLVKAGGKQRTDSTHVVLPGAEDADVGGVRDADVVTRKGPAAGVAAGPWW